MRVIKNPIELQVRLEMLMKQWEFIHNNEVANKDVKLYRLNEWISTVNSELEFVNKQVVREVNSK